MSDGRVTQKIVLAGVVIHDGRILILKRSDDEDILPGLWELPSGKKEPLEGWRDALIREVSEETGLETEPVMPVTVFDYAIEKPDGTRDTTQINFLMSVVGGTEVKLSGEHADFAWVSEDELENYEISDKTREAIVEAFMRGK